MRAGPGARTRARFTLQLSVAVALLSGCGGSGPEPATAPISVRLPPPEVGPAPIFRLPALTKTRLANGLGVQVLEHARLPVVELRLVVLSGSATDAEHPGVAAITGQLLQTPRSFHQGRADLVEQLEALGAAISVSTGRDATSIRLAVSKHDLDKAMALLAQIATTAHFTQEEFEKVRRREVERVSGLARTDSSWIASMALYRQLFRRGSRQHPYARHAAIESELQMLTVEDCERWHATHFSPRNAFVIVTGDTTQTHVASSAQLAFARWSGAEVPPPMFFEPASPGRLKILLAHRPASEHSELRVATLGPERQSSLWPRVQVASQLLGGGATSRLVQDLAGRRALARKASTLLEEVAYGPSPIVMSASTLTDDAATALGALLEHLDAMADQPKASEVQTSTRHLQNQLLLRLETTAAAADLASRLRLFSLSDGYYAGYRAELGRVSATEVQATAAQFFRSTEAVVVVTGDARRLERPLSHFGQVHILNPQDGFRVERVVTHDPSAPILISTPPGREENSTPSGGYRRRTPRRQPP